MPEAIERRLQRLEDTQAIGDLKAAYCNAADGGWDRPTHDYDALASLFVEDGVWDAGEYGGRCEGREAIRALIRSFRAWPFAFHRITNPVIRVDGDSAVGEWHVLVAIRFRANRDAVVGGIYRDDFVRTSEGWRFETVRFEPAFEARLDSAWKLMGRGSDGP